MSRVTIRDLAERCGVSTFTVSAALAGDVRVAKKTRERILRCAVEIGYRRNAAASRMRRGCCETLVLIIDDLHHDNAVFDEFREFGVQREWLCGIAVCTRDYGFDLKLLPASERDFNAETLKRHLGYPEADGVIFFGMDYQQELYQAALECNVCHIAIKPRCLQFDVTPYVDVNSVPAMKDAVNHLLERGHRRIVYSAHREICEPWLIERYSGYEQILMENGYFDPDLVFIAPDRAAIRKLVETRAARREFSAIMCYNDLSARVWIDELNYAGFRIPDDFAVVGYDGKSYLSALSTIDAKGFELGYRAAETLIKSIRNGIDPVNQIITAEFIARQTT